MNKLETKLAFGQNMKVLDLDGIQKYNADCFSRNEVKIEFRADFEKRVAKLEHDSLNKDSAMVFIQMNKFETKLAFGQNMKILYHDEI